MIPHHIDSAIVLSAIVPVFNEEETIRALFSVLSLISQMALNIRYLLPALPAAYLCIGILTEAIWNRYGFVKVTIGLLICGEIAFGFPYYFSYANPLFGGRYRIPPALHASNFDGAQDLWMVAKWLRENPPLTGVRRFVCVHSSVPKEAISFDAELPPVDDLRSFVQHKKSLGLELVVMRGLGAPAPWTKALGGDEERSKLIRRLLLTRPTEWISPTVVVYRNGNHSAGVSTEN